MPGRFYLLNLLMNQKIFCFLVIMHIFRKVKPSKEGYPFVGHGLALHQIVQIILIMVLYGIIIGLFQLLMLWKMETLK